MAKFFRRALSPLLKLLIDKISGVKTWKFHENSIDDGEG